MATAVEKFVTAIFGKLTSARASTERRRVPALLMFLRAPRGGP
jgi:hypothetical protein